MSIREINERTMDMSPRDSVEMCGKKYSDDSTPTDKDWQASLGRSGCLTNKRKRGGEEGESKFHGWD